MKKFLKQRKALAFIGALALAFDAALVLAVATLPAFDPEVAGSWCNLRVTAAVNEAFGTGADPGVIAMNTDGNAFAASTAVWTGEFATAQVRFCRDVSAATTTNNQ